jgi:hypothetical protein
LPAHCRDIVERPELRIETRDHTWTPDFTADAERS